VDIYAFVSWALALIAAITLLLPLSIPLLALAYKVRHGGKPIDMEPQEFWTRSTYAALGLAGLTLLLLGLLYLILEIIDFKDARRAVQLALLMAYIPAGAAYLFWVFALEDFFQGLSVFAVYLLLPALPVLLLGRLFKLWQWLAQVAPWLLSQSS
jgi:hypothetical protein